MLVEHAFGTIGVSRVSATTMAVNVSSRRVLEKVGLTWQRTLFEACPNKYPARSTATSSMSPRPSTGAGTGSGYALSRSAQPDPNNAASTIRPP